MALINQEGPPLRSRPLSALQSRLVQ
jgi:hypothetical protein